MAAVALILGLLLLAWTLFLFYIEQYWPRTIGTIVAKDDNFLGNDAPHIVYTLRYRSDRGVFEGNPTFSHISRSYKLGEKIDLIINPWDNQKCYISNNWASLAVYFLVSVSLLIIAALYK